MFFSHIFTVFTRLPSTNPPPPVHVCRHFPFVLAHLEPVCAHSEMRSEVTVFRSRRRAGRRETRAPACVFVASDVCVGARGGGGGINNGGASSLKSCFCGVSVAPKHHKRPKTQLMPPMLPERSPLVPEFVSSERVFFFFCKSRRRFREFFSSVVLINSGVHHTVNFNE